jgi:hypothetical protein
LGTACCTVLFIAGSSQHYLDVSLFEKIQDYKEEDPKQQQVGSKASEP